ncbi:MAG: DUF4388 domain-containing protein [Myxococcaceae bacterium]
MKSVLLAENHAPTLEHLEGQLTQAGYSVRVASDPDRAMEMFSAERPDAVVVAVDFPHLGDQHLGRHIRATEHGKRAVLIAIDKGHLKRQRGVSEMLDVKPNGYVINPMDANELLSKLKTALAVSEAPRTPGTETGTQKTLSRPAVASGELKSLPLPSLLHSFYRVAREGILVVAHRDLSRRVFVVKGVPVAYDSNARQDALPFYLVERGQLTEAQAADVLKNVQAGMRIGAALAEAGSSLEGEDVLQSLRDYTRDKVAQLIGMRSGRYAFYAGDEFIEETAQVEIPALAPILDGARAAFPVKTFAQSLKGHTNEFPHRTTDFGKDLPALGLDTNDLKVAMQMNGRIPLKELIAHGRGELREAYSLLWFLKLTGDVAFSRTPLSSPTDQAYAALDRIAPRKRKPLPPEIVTELRDAAVKIITASYFRVLGLDISADTEAVERAYHQVAARFHPDSYSDYDTSEIKDLLDSVQDKLAASYRVLSSDDKRKAYLQFLLSRLDVKRTSVNPDAEIALKRGETALKKKDFPTALKAFEQAVQLNPREPEYYSFHGWATWLAGSTEKKERAKAAQKLLKKALSLNPYLERATVISAIIESETGDTSAARKKLLKVLELNPRSQIAKAALLKVGR